MAIRNARFRQGAEQKKRESITPPGHKQTRLLAGRSHQASKLLVIDLDDAFLLGDLAQICEVKLKHLRLFLLQQFLADFIFLFVKVRHGRLLLFGQHDHNPTPRSFDRTGDFTGLHAENLSGRPGERTDVRHLALGVYELAGVHSSAKLLGGGAEIVLSLRPVREFLRLL